MDYLPSWLQPKPPPSLDGGASSSITANERDAITHADNDAQEHPTEMAAAMTSTEAAPRATEELQQRSAFNYGPSLAIPLTGASLALVAGGVKSAKHTALVFMAENTHRRPNTVQGWYFYNKTKNYKVMLGAVRGGVNAAGRVGILTMAYVAIEEASELARNRYIEQHSKDGHDLRQATWNGRWIDGGIAGTGVAAAASLAYRFPRPSAMRALRIGLITGAAVGGLRELRSYVATKRLEQQQEAQTIKA